jgi:hypothetical protein
MITDLTLPTIIRRGKGEKGKKDVRKLVFSTTLLGCKQIMSKTDESRDSSKFIVTININVTS